MKDIKIMITAKLKFIYCILFNCICIIHVSLDTLYICVWNDILIQLVIPLS